MKRFILPFLLFLSHSCILLAQGNERLEVTIPVLNEHKFLVSRLVPGAFIKTSFNNRLGLGVSQRVDIPSIEIGGTEVTPNPDELVFVELAFLYNQKIRDWISFYIDAGLGARVGTGPGSLIAQGLNTYSGVNLGWKIRLWEHEKHMLTSTIGITNSAATFINVLGYVQDVVDSVRNPELNETSNVLRSKIGLNYAWGISSLFGLQANANYSYGDSFERGKSTSEYYVAGAFDCNLFPKTTVPLGFSLGLGYATLPEFSYGSEDESFIVNFKVSYTGSPSLLISLDYTGFQTKLGLGRNEGLFDSTARVSSFLLNMIYYFN